MIVKIDAGHGGIDPGVIDTKRNIKEKDANLETALTLKYLLEQQGIRVLLSRHDDTRPEYADRISQQGQQVTICVHYNSMGTYKCVYYQQGSDKSHNFATTLAYLCGIKLTRVWSSATEHRWGRLYIDDTKGLVVLWEVDSIDGYQDTKAYRMERCIQVVKAVKAHFGVN